MKKVVAVLGITGASSKDELFDTMNSSLSCMNTFTATFSRQSIIYLSKVGYPLYNIRIKDNGTNITVYHNFHDEVNLYKQHWWRCDGPCQKRRPYFGMVRRATNRAPGSNDLWWAEHARTCGGQFIKVKEPEKPVKPKTSKTQAESKTKSPDIRKFFPTNKSATSATGTVKSKSVTTVKTVNGNNEPTPKINKVFSNSNIFGFENLNGDSCCNGTSKNEKSNKNNKKPLNNNRTSTGNKFNSSNSVSNGDYYVVRNHWANKFSNTTNSSPESKPESTSCRNINSENNRESHRNNLEPGRKSKSSSGDPSENRSHGINKFCNTGDITEKKKIPKKRLSVDLPETPTEKIAKVIKLNTDCPVCSKKIPQDEINEHLDACLEKGPSKNCYICGVNVPESDFERHINSCMEDYFNADGLVNDAKENDDVFQNAVKDNDIVDDSETKVNTKETDSSNKIKMCDIYNKSVREKNFDLHASDCLHKMFDRIKNRSKDDRSYSEPSTSSKITKQRVSFDSNVECLACKKKISKSELNDHLEECMNLSNIFENDNEPLEGQSDAKKLYNCPCCMKLFSEFKMNDHIDICLNQFGDK